MGSQIIIQPNGRYAVWSSVVDGITIYDCEPKDILDYWLEREKERLSSALELIIKNINEGNTKRSYFQFTKTWDEALKEHEENHGPLLMDESNEPEKAALSNAVQQCLTACGVVREDDGERITADWLMTVMPCTTSHGKRAEHRGRLGRMSWQGTPSDLCLWLNGELIDWRQIARGQLRALCSALGVVLNEGEK